MPSRFLEGTLGPACDKAKQVRDAPVRLPLRSFEITLAHSAAPLASRPSLPLSHQPRRLVTNDRRPAALAARQSEWGPIIPLRDFPVAPTREDACGTATLWVTFSWLMSVGPAQRLLSARLASQRSRKETTSALHPASVSSAVAAWLPRQRVRTAPVAASGSSPSSASMASCAERPPVSRLHASFNPAVGENFSTSPGDLHVTRRWCRGSAGGYIRGTRQPGCGSLGAARRLAAAAHVRPLERAGLVDLWRLGARRASVTLRHYRGLLYQRAPAAQILPRETLQVLRLEMLGGEGGGLASCLQLFGHLQGVPGDLIDESGHDICEIGEDASSMTLRARCTC